MLERVDEAMRSRGLLRKRQSVLVAVSGGVDSMALLHVLHQLAAKHSWRLAVAHLNHGLRGRSSDADQRLVERTARALKLIAVTERCDVQSLAAKQKLSIEMAARQARHRFLARAAKKLRIKTIALAHHADDQVELFFLRLLRGSGGEGLRGMKWSNPSPVDPSVTLIRPLLEQTKAELAKHAAAEKIEFREDASNASLDIQRNRIRHELLPLLKRRYQPGLERTVLRLMDIIGAEAEFTTGSAAEWLEQGRPAFDEIPAAVQRRVLQIQLLRANLTADFDLIERLRTAPNRPVTVLPQVAVTRDLNGRLSVTEPPAHSTSSNERLELELRRQGKAFFGNLEIAWQLQPGRGGRLEPHVSGREFFDAGRIGSAIVLRHWQPGDRFQPIGMSRAVKLQDLFTNQKVPRARRHELVVATTRDGEVFWVEGLRISERFKLSDNTIRRLQWRWKDH